MNSVQAEVRSIIKLLRRKHRIHKHLQASCCMQTDALHELNLKKYDLDCEENILNAMAVVGRSLASLLLTINFILAVVGAALAGWALNRNFDSQVGKGNGYVGNAVTTVFLPLALVACCVTIAAKIAGGHHLRVWRTDSLAAAAATALIALLLTLLTLGVAIKEIKIGGYRPKRLKALEAIIIILGFFELLYTMSLHAGVVDEKYGPTYA